MARRSEHTRDELKTLMVTTAKDIISKEGLSALSARQLADKIGYSAGTIYNIFKNLNEIIFCVESEVLDCLEQQLLEIPNNTEPDQQLQLFTKTYMDFISQNFNLWTLICEHMPPIGSPLPDWYPVKIERLMSLLEKKIQPFFTPDKQDECKRSARVFWASLHGVLTFSGCEKFSQVDLETQHSFIEHLVTTYIAGLKYNQA